MTCASRRTCTGGEEKISTIYFNFLSGNEIIICVWSTHRLVYIFSRIEMLQMHLLLIWTACLPDYYGRLMAFTNSQIKSTFPLSQIMEVWCFWLQEPVWNLIHHSSHILWRMLFLYTWSYLTLHPQSFPVWFWCLEYRDVFSNLYNMALVLLNVYLMFPYVCCSTVPVKPLWENV